MRWLRRSRPRAGAALALAGDVREEAFAQALVEAAVSRFGGLDVAFNNAGAFGEMGPTPEISLAGWTNADRDQSDRRVPRREASDPRDARRGGGSLIFTSTFVGHTAGMPGVAAYAASKAGLIGLTQALAVEFGARRHPGECDPAGRHRHADGPGDGTTRRRRVAFVGGLHALKRMATPDEQAQIGALPGIGCLELHDRHRAPGRRRRLDQSHLSGRPRARGSGRVIHFNQHANHARYRGNLQFHPCWRP